MKKIKAKMTLEKLAERMDFGFKRVDGNLAKLAEKMESGFDNLEKKMMERFDGVGEEFVKVHEKFVEVNERFDKVDATMEHNRAELSSRLTSVERRTMVLEGK